MSRTEHALSGLVALAAAALLLFEILFLGRCSLAFDCRDPRLDARPWVDPAFDTRAAINPITPDLDAVLLPGLMRARQLLAAGEPPWRDSSQLLGFPFAGNVSWPVFYPPGWPLLLVPDPVDALDFALLFHTAVGLYLAYRGARRLGAAPAAAAVAAAGFALSAFMTTRWREGLILWSATWWPGLLAAWSFLRDGNRRRALAEGALWTFLSAAAGFAQIALALALGFVALTAAHRATRAPRSLATAALGAALGLALAWPQLAHSAHAYAESQRSDSATRAATVARGLPPAAMAGIALPEFFGRPSDFAGPAPPAPRMEEWLPQRRWIAGQGHSQNSVAELGLYPGLLVLLLAPLALRRASGSAARVLLWLALGALALAVAWPALAASAPALAALGAGNIKRLLVLFSCSLPFAAALALEGWRQGRSRAPYVLAALAIAGYAVLPLLAARIDDPAAPAFAAALRAQCLVHGALAAGAAAALAAARRAPFAAWLLAPLLACDLGASARAFNPFVAQREAWPDTPALAALRERGGRVAVLGQVNVLPAPPAAARGVRSVHGMLPMVPARAAELLACVEGPLSNPLDPRVARPFEQPASLRHPVLDLLGVATAVAGDPSLAAAVDLPLLFESHREGLAAWRRDGALPRAFVVAGAEVVRDRTERLARLADRGFDPRATVLLEDAPRQPLPRTGAFTPARLLAADEHRFEIATDAREPGVLVLSEGFDSWFEVEVDGAPARLLAADHALLGVELDAGPHRVLFRFAPPPLHLFVPFAALAAVAWTCRPRRRSRG